MLRTRRELDQDGPTDKGRAFRVLFNETACERVRVWLQRSGVPLRDRDDVSQKVFLAAFRKFATYEPTRAPPDRWLHGITRRIAKQYWTWAKDTREDLTPDPITEDVDEHPIADEVIVRGEEATEAYDLLQRVELDLRWVLVLNLYDGVPVKEIAAERGIPLSTTYALRARALAAWLAVVEAYRREQAERMEGGWTPWGGGRALSG